jgi:hypothetical protein
MRTLIFLILLGAALLVIPSDQAQQPATTATTTAAVTIEVRDQTGASVPHARVRLEPPPNPLPDKMETDDNGSLQLSLANGTYALIVTAQGFEKITQHIDINDARMLHPVTHVFRVMLEVGHTGSPVAVYSKDSLVLNAAAYHLPISYSPAEFRALPHVEIKLHNEHTNSDETYSGVPLATLLAQANVPLGKELRGEALTSYLIVSGSDGYSVLLSLAEVDPSFHAGQVLVADTRNGQPLGDHGPFELIVSDDKRPARWVHNLNSIALQSGH